MCCSEGARRITPTCPETVELDVGSMMAIVVVLRALHPRPCVIAFDGGNPTLFLQLSMGVRVCHRGGPSSLFGGQDRLTTFYSQ